GRVVVAPIPGLTERVPRVIRQYIAVVINPFRRVIAWNLGCSLHAEVGADIHPRHGPDAKMARPIVILGNFLNPEIISPTAAGWLRLDAGLRLSLGIRGYGDRSIGIRNLAGWLGLGRSRQRQPRKTTRQAPRKPTG